MSAKHLKDGHKTKKRSTHKRAEKRYSARLYDEMCIQSIMYDKDRSPADYIR